MAEKPPKRPDKGSKKRNVVQITLDDATEARLKKWLDRQRVKPERPAIVLTALIEFLDREERKDS